MKLTNNQQAEKSLKRFLKKKITYTTSLLIVFLITGGIAQGTSEEISAQVLSTQDALLGRIAEQKQQILAQIAENDARLKELTSDRYELIRKGNFYSKPIYNSDMVLFPVIIENSGKMKNRSRNQFKTTSDQAKEYYSDNGYNMNADRNTASQVPLPGLTTEEAKGKTYDEQIQYLIEKNKGVLPKINKPDTIVVDLGVNIQTVEPIIPKINVDTQVDIPEVKLPTLVTPQVISLTTPAVPTMPTVATVSVEAPTPVERIQVAEPTLVEPEPPQERIVTVVTPTSPGVFDPLTISAPAIPAAPNVSIPSAPSFNIMCVSYFSMDGTYVDGPLEQNAVISEVAVTNGKFNIIRDEGTTYPTTTNQWGDNTWNYKYDNYDVINISTAASIPTDDHPAAIGQVLTGLTTGGVLKVGKGRGFMRNENSNAIYTNANIVVSRGVENKDVETDELIHLDTHSQVTGDAVTTALTTASTAAGKSADMLAAWKDSKAIADGFTGFVNKGNSDAVYHVGVNQGDIFIEGGNMSFTNNYTHGLLSGGIGAENVTINTGNITVQPYDNGTYYGGNNAVFVVSPDLWVPADYTLYNGKTGNIDVYTKNSAAYLINAGSTDFFGSSTVPTTARQTVYQYDYDNYQMQNSDIMPMDSEIYSSDISVADYINGLKTTENGYATISRYNPYREFENYTVKNEAYVSTVNRGNISMYGAGSTGVYLKTSGVSDYTLVPTSQGIALNKPVGSVQRNITFFKLDKTNPSDWITYPDHGWPILEQQTVTITYNSDGTNDFMTVPNQNNGYGKLNVQFVEDDGTTPAPLKIYGDKSIGIYSGKYSDYALTVSTMSYKWDPVTKSFNYISYVTAAPVSATKYSNSTISGNAYIDLGDAAGNANATYNSTAANTNGNAITGDTLGNTNLDTIDGSVGILSGAPVDLTSHGIRIFKENKGSIGVGVLNDKTFKLGTGYINIYGGTDNVGAILEEGNIESQGEINISGGTGNVGVLQSNGAASYSIFDKINVGDTTNAAKGSVGIYATNAGTELTHTGLINVYGNNYGVFATDGGKAIISKTSLTGTSSAPDINVIGAIDPGTGKASGVGIIAATGTTAGTVEARNTYIKSENGSAAIASIGTGSLVDLQGSVVDYKGTSYAVYSDGVGKIDLTNNGEIKLRGGAALELNMSLGTQPVLFDTTSKITMLSNDAIALNLTNVTTPFATSTLRTTIIGLLGGVNIVDGVEGGTTYDNYKIAANDGGSLTIDTPLNKADTTPTSDSFFFFRRFMAQRMNIAVQKNIDAILTSQYASDYFRGQVTGLELSSSALATGRADTNINISAGVTITADRTDAGTGAIGVYENFGDFTNNGDIKVETGTNTINDGGIGVYAVNGTIANNIGNIEVSGNNALGMYGLSYRVNTDGIIVPMEFGSTLTDQGNTEITNAGSIKMNGDNSIGMYALNNSSDPSLVAGTPTKTLVINNTGTIDVSTGKTNVGIYSIGTTNITNNGTIKVGEEGTGIYAGENGNIIKIGTIDLGKDAAGIILEGNAVITDTATYTPVGTWTTGEKGKIGILAKGPVAGTVDTSPITISNNINASGLDHGLALYIKDKSNVTSTGNIDVGNVGVGIYLDNGSGINTGTISLGTSANAAGMYATNGTLTNQGTINVTDDGQIGMVAYGANGVIENTGTINLNADNSAGVYAKNGAVYTHSGTGTINITGSKDFGIFADGSTINLGSPVTFTQPNANENVFVYAKNGSTINHTSGGLTVNGGGASGNQKTIGVYLNNSGTINTYDSTGGTITVQGGSVGIYSKNVNNINVTQVDAIGDKTVGMYLENGGNISGKVTSSGATATESVVGVYGNGGAINVSGPLTLEMGASNTYGLGMFLENGVTVNGADITVNNMSTANTNVGIYYTGSNTIVHGTNVTLVGNKIVGFYTDNNMKLSSSKDITFTAGNTEQVGAYVLGNSSFDNTSGTINVLADSSTAIYTGDGTGTNEGTVEVNGQNSAGLIAQGSLATSVANVINKGIINVNKGVGMLLGDIAGPTVLGQSKGKNTGTINVGAGNTGVALSGNDASSFDGTGGTINITGAAGNSSTGIIIKNITSGQIANAGTLNLGNSDSIGIYALDSDIDFDVAIGSQNGGTGIYADGTTGGNITGNIDASASKGTVALYVGNSSYTLNGATITSGSSLAGGVTGVGIYFADNYTLTNTIVNTTGNGVGIAIAPSKILDFSTGAVINVKETGTGIYIGGTGTTLDTTGGTINIDGAGTGISVGSGATANLGVAGPLYINFTGSGGVFVAADIGGTVNIGTNVVTTGSGTYAATVNGNLVNNSSLDVSSGSVGLQGSFTTSGSLLNSTTGSITVHSGGIGMSASGTGTVTVTNDGTMLIDGDGAVGIASDVGTISNGSASQMTVKNNGIGIYAKGNANITNLNTIDVTSGVGFVSDGSSSSPTGTVILNDGTSTSYSIGGYFIDTSSIPSTYNVTQNGNYTIGNVAKGSGTTTVSQINTLGGTGKKHQIGLMAQGTTGILNVNVLSAVNILDGGENNIGIYGKNTAIDMGSSNITVGKSEVSQDMSKASIGAYIENGSFASTGNTSVGQYSIGILGKAVDNIKTGIMTVADKAIGIYGEGKGTGSIEATSVTAGNNAIGIYGKNISEKVSNGLIIGNNSSIGIINEGTGDISLDGHVQIADVANIDNKEGSVAIYKSGDTGNINVGTNTISTIDVGREGYGIYAKGTTTGNINVNNAATMNLGISAVGIYGTNNVNINNSGTIVVGDTYLGAAGSHLSTLDHRNSVGIYAENGAKVNSNGNITVAYDHSVGIYGKGAGTSVRLTGGTLTVDNGGVGILVKEGAIATIASGANLIVNETNAPSCGGNSIGVAAYGNSTVNNEGNITVNNGVGLYLTTGARFTNNGVLTLNNGVGIGGQGTYVVGPSGSTIINGGTLVAATEEADKTKGSVTISKDGTVTINGNYITTGGTFDAGDTSIKLNGAYVAIEALTDTQVPLFKSEVVEGNIKLLPDFATTGNGYAWTIKNFDKALGAAIAEAGATSKVSISTSPLFVKKEVVLSTGEEAMQIVKVPYTDLVMEKQYKEMYNGLDNILYNGEKGNDTLKKYNAYLEKVADEGGTEEFNNELAQGLSEMRGDIYATMQKRMQDVQRAYDSTWEELEKQYDPTKDVDKYSVIYKHGNYKDDTIGIDDYKYDVYGMMYMKEIESRDYNNKMGVSAGFTVSKFQFDDADKFSTKSKEDIYSIRIGAHNVRSLIHSDESDKTRLITRFEIGYNRHEAKRSVELDSLYRNKGHYNSYQVTLDNKIEHNLTRSYDHKLDLYGAINMEYGIVDKFTEKGEAVRLKLKTNDYFSIQPEVGIQGEKRVHLGKKVSTKLTGKVAYAYELGENYRGNKAKIKGGGTDSYNLIEPKNEKGIVKGSIGLTFEKADKAGITFAVEARKHDNKKEPDIAYSARLKYVF